MSAGQIVVVGGGPAGMAAALEAARAGAQVTLVEESASLGGQYYKQMPLAWTSERPSRLDRQYGAGRKMIEDLRTAGVEVLTGTLVWSVLEDQTLALTDDTHIWQQAYSRLILSTGAWELSVALPGWTLPGVLTGGGAQSLVISQGILPGRRILLAGVGPFQLRVAAQLIEAGADIVGILDAADVLTSLGSAVRLLPNWRLAKEGLDYLAIIRRAGVKIFRAHLPTRIVGGDHVERVIAARVDSQWRPVPGADVSFDVDAVCLTYGFVPSVELARLAGCEVECDPGTGMWVVRHDAHQMTSVSGVFVAGETGGIEGSTVALSEGRLAGLEAARQLGLVDDHQSEKRRVEIDRVLAHARVPAGILHDLTRPQPGLFELMTDETIVCRCEDVSAMEIRQAAERWEPGPRSVKFWTRAGMGRCQGRVCGHLISRLIARAKGISMEAISLDTPRAPVKPVSLAAMASPRERTAEALGAWHDSRH